MDGGRRAQESKGSAFGARVFWSLDSMSTAFEGRKAIERELRADMSLAEECGPG